MGWIGYLILVLALVWAVQIVGTYFQMRHVRRGTLAGGTCAGDPGLPRDGSRPEPRVLPPLPPHQPGDPDLRGQGRHLRRTLHHLREEADGAEVVAVAKRDLEAGEKLGGIGDADYYGVVYPAPEARGMLPIGLAAGARTTRAVSKGSAIPQTGVELPENSFVVNLRQLQDAALEG